MSAKSGGRHVPPIYRLKMFVRTVGKLNARTLAKIARTGGFGTSLQFNRGEGLRVATNVPLEGCESFVLQYRKLDNPRDCHPEQVATDLEGLDAERGARFRAAMEVRAAWLATPLDFGPLRIKVEGQPHDYYTLREAILYGFFAHEREEHAARIENWGPLAGFYFPVFATVITDDARQLEAMADIVREALVDRERTGDQ